MGIASRSLSKEVLANAGIERLQNQHVRRQLRPCLEGYVVFSLIGNPPTTTHHDKNLAVHDGRPVMRDHPRLIAAREWYSQRLPERSELVPLDPTHGIVVRFEFRWSLPLDTGKWPPLARYGGYRHEKPDLDNAKKAVLDILVERGWLVDDSHVVKDGGSEKRWCWPHEQPGVRIFMRSLARPQDSGATLDLGVGEAYGVLHPAPWKCAADLASVHHEARLESVRGRLKTVLKAAPQGGSEGKGHNGHATGPMGHAGALDGPAPTIQPSKSSTPVAASLRYTGDRDKRGAK